MVLSPDFLRKR